MRTVPLRTSAMVLAVAVQAMVFPALTVSAAGSSPFGHRDMDAAIDLDTAYRLPGIYATDLSFTNENGVIAGAFTALNTEKSAVGPVTYALEVRPVSGMTDDAVTFARVASGETFTLEAGEQRPLTFRIALPSLPSDQYVFRVQMASAEGHLLGWSDLPLTVSGAAPFLSITEPAVELLEYDGRQEHALAGPNVSARGQIALRATVCNPSTRDVTVIPTLDTYRFDIVRGGVATVSFEARTFSAGACEDIRLPMTVASAPEIYQGLLRFVDPVDGAQRSAVGEYRWVVRGADAGIFPVHLGTIGMKKGEMTTVKADVVGAGDAETTVQAQVSIELIDAEGTLAVAKTEEAPLSDVIAESIATLQLSRDPSGPQTIRVTVRDARGTVLATQDTAVPLHGHQTVAGTVYPGIALAVFAAFALAAMAGLTLFILGRREFIPQAAFACVIVLSFGQFFSALAAGNGNGIEVVTPSPSTVAHNLQGGSLVALFINAPIHNAPAGTYPKNAVPLQYRVTYAVCQNRISYMRVLGRFDLNGGKQTTLAGTNANWQMIHDKLFSDGAACPNNTHACLRSQDFSGTVDLSALPANACGTTLQMLVKWSQSGWAAEGFAPADIPNTSFDPNDWSFSNTIGKLAHGVNLWINFTCTADLRIQKTGPATIQQGQNATYTLIVTNDGPLAATANVTDTVPTGLAFLSASGASCLQQGAQVQCANLSFQPNETKTIQITFAQPSPLACGSVVLNTAAVTAQGNVDPNSGNNTSQTVTSTVQCAASSSSSSSLSSSSLSSSSLSSSSVSSATPQCRDNVDNDGDGATDYPSDFSCSGPDDNDETLPKAQCQDGVDNDSDGKVDFPNDPGCSSYQDNDEYNPASSSSSALPQCRDGIDNDGDGATDHPHDFSCSSPDDNDESLPRSQCQDGVDNDGDGKVDFPNDPGCSSYQDNDEYNQVQTQQPVTQIPAMFAGNPFFANVNIPVGIVNNNNVSANATANANANANPVVGATANPVVAMTLGQAITDQVFTQTAYPTGGNGIKGFKDISQPQYIALLPQTGLPSFTADIAAQSVALRPMAATSGSLPSFAWVLLSSFGLTAEALGLYVL